jgi:hypothetical protein
MRALSRAGWFPVLSRLAMAAVVLACLGRADAQELPAALGLASGYGGSLSEPSLPGPAGILLQESESPREDPRFQGTLFKWKSEGGNPGGPQLKNPLVTDRPDFTESSVGVGWGVRQVEFGYTFTSSSSGGVRVRTQTAGEQLLRAGVHADWLEFRLGMVPGFLSDSIDGFDLSLPLVFEQTRTNGAASSTAGFPDLYTGFKVALFPQEGNLPEVAVIPQLNIPTGTASFSSDKLEPGINLVYGWELDETYSTAGSTQVNRRYDEGGTGYAEFAQSWTIARSLSERLGAYAEWYAFFPEGSDTAGSEQYLNGGLAWALTDDFQFDVRIGFGLNDESDDFFVGTGFSVRFQ